MAQVSSEPLRRHRFTADDYHRMAEAGILCPDDRVELLDGEIVPMAPIGPTHAACVSRLTRLLVNALGDRATLRVQLPVRLDEHSEPEPDLAVVRFRDDDYAGGHPGASDVLLLIEVADSSLVSDRRVKLPLYAGAGIGEVWLVNLVDKAVEVYRQPAGDRFNQHTDYRDTQTISPAMFEGFSVAVGDLVF